MSSYHGYPKIKLQKVFIDAIKDAGFNNTELAEKSGLSRQHVSKLLNGRVRGTMPVWEQLLDAAGVIIGYRLRSRRETRSSNLAR